MRSRHLLARAACLFLLVSSTHAQFTTTRIADGLFRPVGAFAPHGDERIFVIEQRQARVRIVQNGSVLSPAFLDIDALVTDTGNERGLLGLAFHPDYASNRRFYVNYNDNSGDTVIAEYLASSTNPNLADPSRARIILQLPQPELNHNGGMIAFGPNDGYLYIGLGDGGGPNDPSNSGQRLDTLLGKMLRIDIDQQDPGLEYAIPPSNPFVGVSGAREEIWDLGLRNPWRWSFDRDTGDLYIGDVGALSWEEIDFEPASSPGGNNFGWRCMEGNACTGLSGCTCNATTLTPPIHEYGHTQGVAVVGGYVYRGCAIPSLQGTYFFADYASARIWSLTYDGSTVANFTDRSAQLAPGGGLSIFTPSSFGEDGFGELLVVDLGGGELFKVVPTTPIVDCNGNSVSDLCDIAMGTSLDLNGNELPDECEALSQDVPSISVVSGGSAQFTLDAGPANAGRLYLLLGSTSGTNPGIPLPPIQIPLNPDFYFNLMLTAPGGLWIGSSGNLDANGRGQAVLTIPPLLAPPNLTLWHAAVLVTPSLDTVTNFLRMELTL